MKAFSLGFGLAALGVVVWLGRRPKPMPVVHGVVHWEGGD